MKLRTICARCGCDEFKIVGEGEPPTLRVTLPSSTPAPSAVAAVAATMKKMALCGCGHEPRDHENGTGRCLKDTIRGRCLCRVVHSKTVRNPDRFYTPDPSSPAPGRASDAGELGDYARQLLGALLVAEKEGTKLSREQIAVRAVVSPSGTFNKTIARLVDEGYACKALGGAWYELTEKGRGAAAALSSRPLLEQWCERLAEYPSLLLGAVAGVYPDSLTRGAIAKNAGVATSGTFNKQIAKLVRMGLVVKMGGGQYAAAAALGIKHGAAA